jgi:hypothetical protein
MVIGCGWPKMTFEQSQLYRHPDGKNSKRLPPLVDEGTQEAPLIGIGPGLRVYETPEENVAVHDDEAELQRQENASRPRKKRKIVSSKEMKDGTLGAGSDGYFHQRWVKRPVAPPIDPAIKSAAIAAYAAHEISREEMMRRITPEKAK